MRLQDAWLTLADDDGHEYAMVCPDCQTSKEQAEVAVLVAEWNG
jgi:hypothetical protein